MDDRRYLAYGFVIEYLDAVSFTSLTCVCKDLNEYNNNFYWNLLWKKGRVPNVKTAYYIEHKLRTYSPESILDEIPNNKVLNDTLHAFRFLLTPEIRRRVYYPRKSKSRLIRREVLHERIRTKRLQLDINSMRCISPS